MKSFYFLFALLWAFASCGKSDNQEGNRLYDAWKYIGYRDKAGKLHAATSFVLSCKSCYSINLKRDNTFDVQICSNTGSGDYQIDAQQQQIITKGYGLTKMGDPMCPDEKGFNTSGSYRFIGDTLAISPNDTLTSLFVKTSHYTPNVVPPRYYKRGTLKAAPKGSYDCTAVSHLLVLEDNNEWLYTHCL